MVDNARVHLQFAMDLCALQVKHHRYFVHEHPWSASSWQTEEVRKVWEMEGVERVRAGLQEYKVPQPMPLSLVDLRMQWVATARPGWGKDAD